MRITIYIFLLFLPSFCIGQSDSMFVQQINGTTREYPLSLIKQITFTGIPTSAEEQELMQNVLSSFALYQNYPNPFNPSTTIQYSVPSPGGEIEVKIFDSLGRLVRSLYNNYQQYGKHSIVWDSRGNNGQVVASGTYFCQVIFNGSAFVKKLLLIK